MERKFFTTILGAILIFLGSSGTASAQVPDTVGVRDSVEVGNVFSVPGALAVVSVYGFNDEEIGALTLPLKYSSENMICDSVSFAGSRIEYINSKPVAIDTILRTIKIGAITVLEPPLSPGSGKLADLFFTIKADAHSETALIDTFSLEDPPLYLSFVYTFPSGPDSGQTVDLVPAFQAGSITIEAENLPPEIDPITTQYVSEGDSLLINVHATDPEEAPLTVSVLNAPPTAFFEDFGDGSGRFIWVPDYYGPYSSTNSPFSVTFFATDGTNSAYQQVEINVINQNAPPVLNLPVQKVIPVGMLLSFSVSATDPDKEPVTVTLRDAPSGSSFDGRNPGIFSWAPGEGDTGEYFLQFVAADPNGAKDSQEVAITVSSVLGYTLNLGNVVGNLGGIVSLPIDLKNSGLIGGMDLLIEFDTTSIRFLEVTKAGTRIEAWEYFTYEITPTEVGKQVRVIGIADVQAGLVTPPLSPGTGVLCYLKFMASTDLAYDGISVPVKFKFIDYTNNTFSDPDANFIPQEEITYNDGWILLQRPQGILLGDLNLNRIPFEIGDIVRFANYFIDPVKDVFNLEQMFNSDVNEDGIQATVADFVFMIRYMLVGGVSSGKALPGGQEATVEIVQRPSELVVYIDSDVEVGGIFLELSSDRAILGNLKISPEIDSLNYQIHKEGDVIRVVIYSEDGNLIKPGLREVLIIPKDKEGDKISLENIQLCDKDGELLKVETVSDNEVASDFFLSQNYPNPFNPETYIDFTLPSEQVVSLKIYNIKGQVVSSLVNRRMAAGIHTVRWDGRNDSGERVSSGVYFYRLTAGEKSFVKKMVLLK